MNPNNLLQALAILSHYYDLGQTGMAIHTGQIWLGTYEPEILSRVDLDRMEQLGWFGSEDSWSVML